MIDCPTESMAKAICDWIHIGLERIEYEGIHGTREDRAAMRNADLLLIPIDDPPLEDLEPEQLIV